MAVEAGAGTACGTDELDLVVCYWDAVGVVEVGGCCCALLSVEVMLAECFDMQGIGR